MIRILLSHKTSKAQMGFPDVPPDVVQRLSRLHWQSSSCEEKSLAQLLAAIPVIGAHVISVLASLARPAETEA